MLSAPDPMFGLLLAAIRWPIGELVAKGSDDVDWERFVGLATRHRVAPLAFRSLLAAKVPIPDTLADRLEQTCQAALFVEMALANEFQRLQQLLGERGVRPVLLKGPGISLRAFSQFGLRTYRDLDLLVAENEVTSAEVAVIAAGYDRVEPNPGLPSDALSAWRKDHKDALFRHPATGQLLELHWRLFDNPSLMSVQALPQPVALSLPPLETALVLPIETELEYLCLHGALHGWSRLRWLADINALLDSVPEALLRDLARVAPAVAQALILCRDLLDTRFAPELDRVLSTSVRGRWLAKLAWSEICRTGTNELEAVPFGSTVKNLSHYALLNGADSMINELRFDFTARPRISVERKGRIADWMSRHLLNR